MNGIFYLKLAVQNIRKNARTYVPYILTCTGSVMMFDILLTLASNEQIAQMNGGSDMRTILNLGCFITTLFTGGFLFYTNSFLMKRRKMEIGLYNILGMGKRHIGKILFFETLIIAAISLTAGIAGDLSCPKQSIFCCWACWKRLCSGDSTFPEQRPPYPSSYMDWCSWSFSLSIWPGYT